MCAPMDDNNRVRQAGPGGRVWHVLDAAGNQIGACSSREDALRIAALVGAGTARVRGEETSHAGDGVVKGEGVTPAPRTAMFEWYAASRRPSAWARLKGLCLSARALSRRLGRAR